MSAGNGCRFNYYPHHWPINSSIKVRQSVGEEGASATARKVTVTAVVGRLRFVSLKRGEW